RPHLENDDLLRDVIAVLGALSGRGSLLGKTVPIEHIAGEEAPAALTLVIVQDLGVRYHQARLQPVVPSLFYILAEHLQIGWKRPDRRSASVPQCLCSITNPTGHPTSSSTLPSSPAPPTVAHRRSSSEG